MPRQVWQIKFVKIKDFVAVWHGVPHLMRGRARHNYLSFKP
jgi:hypothetical protein